MRSSNYRTFKIERGEGRTPFKFAVQTRNDGGIQVTRINPYDETEYHWALKSAGRNFWSIIRNGQKVSNVGPFIGGKPDEAAEALSPEQIAYFLIEADIKAKLEPCISIN